MQNGVDSKVVISKYHNQAAGECFNSLCYPPTQMLNKTSKLPSFKAMHHVRCDYCRSFATL